MAAALAVLASTIGMLALLAVMIFWGAGKTTAALPYLAVPGVLWASRSAAAISPYARGHTTD